MSLRAWDILVKQLAKLGSIKSIFTMSFGLFFLNSGFGEDSHLSSEERSPFAVLSAFAFLLPYPFSLNSVFQAS